MGHGARVRAVTSILGLDISSFALHGCLLVDGQPPVLRMETLGKPTDPIIERLRRVHMATWNLTVTPVHDMPFRTRPHWVVIEEAFGKNRNADRALNRTIGAIIASVPSESQIAIVSTGDWRRAIGAKNTKLDGHAAVASVLLEEHPSMYPWPDLQLKLDEHQLDSCGIALAWQRILEQQVAA